VFEILMRRHNQRVYRVARAVVKDEAEVEDVMQQACAGELTRVIEHAIDNLPEPYRIVSCCAMSKA
jgi:RNA polymerase sigma-70 factor (ECF subfamily)